MHYSPIIIFTLINFTHQVSCIEKPYRLKVLSLLPLTGSELDFRQCLAAETFVAETVNNRSDILPDYHVEFAFRDEGLSSMTAVREAIKFIREMEEGHDDVFLAPISAGVLNTPGCKSWGSTVHHFNMVMTAGSCSAPSQTAQRTKYPNMYRIRGPTELTIASRLAFLRKIAPHMRKIAIVMFVNTNPYNLEASTYFSDISIKNGFEIVAFEATPDFSDSFVQNLKEKDFRIFVMEAPESNMIQLFLCKAHRAGIRGRKYLFIFQLLAFSDPNMLPDAMYSTACTRATHKAQLQQSLYIGTTLQILAPPGGVTAIGHSLEDFERTFLAYVNFQKKLDYSFRHICYDIALHALIVLNQTETNLAKQGMSLRDFRSHPGEVMRVANESAQNIRFHMLRFADFKYSHRLEWDYEPQFVAIWREGKGLQPRYSILLPEGTRAENVTAYSVQAMIPLDFDIPRDSPRYATIPRDVSDEAFFTTLVICILIFVGQYVLFGFTIGNLSPWHRVYKLLLLLGFTLVNIGSIVSIPYAGIRTSAICGLQLIVITIGVSIVQGLASFKMHHSLNVYFAALHVRSAIADRLDKAELRKATAFAFGYCIANAIIVTAWLWSDPLMSQELMNSPSIYDSGEDTFTQFLDIYCASEKGNIPMAVLIVANVVFLLLNFGMLTASRKIDGTIATSNFLLELKELKLALMFSSTLLLAIVAICYISVTYLMRDLVITYGLLFYSAAMSAIVNYAAISPYFVKEDETKQRATIHLTQPPRLK